MDIIEQKIKYYFDLKVYELNGLLFEKPTSKRIEKEIKDNDNIKTEIYILKMVFIYFMIYH